MSVPFARVPHAPLRVHPCALVCPADVLVLRAAGRVRAARVAAKSCPATQTSRACCRQQASASRATRLQLFPPECEVGAGRPIAWRGCRSEAVYRSCVPPSPPPLPASVCHDQDAAPHPRAALSTRHDLGTSLVPPVPRQCHQTDLQHLYSSVPTVTAS